MRRGVVGMTVGLLLCAVALAGCGSDQGEDPEPSTGSGDAIEITFSGDTVEPNGERVEVKVGQTIELVVKADKPGELHVHSTPEQGLEYGAGTTNLKLTLDQPGVVDVESHHLEVVILQLEVR